MQLFNQDIKVNGQLEADYIVGDCKLLWEGSATSVYKSDINSSYNFLAFVCSVIGSPVCRTIFVATNSGLATFGYANDLYITDGTLNSNPAYILNSSYSRYNILSVYGIGGIANED